MVDAMLQGASDVVLMLCPPSRGDTDAKLLRRDRPTAIVHRDHELAQNTIVTIAELAKHTLVLAPRLFAKGSHDLVLGILQMAGTVKDVQNV